MFIIPLIFYLIFRKKPKIKTYVCNHEHDTANFYRQKEPEQLLPESSTSTQSAGVAVTLDSESSSPIRIYFDLTPIGNTSVDSSTYVVDETQLEVIKETFQNVGNYISKRVNVTSKTTGTISGSVSPTSSNSGYSFNHSDCDLVIVVFSRSVNGDTLASASVVGQNSNKRPEIGRVIIYVETMELSEAQDEYTADRTVFVTLLHELNHILSFNSGMFKYWNTSAEMRSVKYRDGYPAQTYLSQKGAPKLHNWTVNRFTLNGNAPKVANYTSGSETEKCAFQLEDGGGTGTELSHPNEHLFFTDVNQGVIFGPAYISELFFMGLEDTGWYVTDSSSAEKLVYLDPELDSTLDFTDEIIVGPPKSVFPSSYLCYKYEEVKCFFDNVYIGLCKSAKGSLSTSEYDNYYFPNGNYYIYDNEVLDYAPIYIPWLSCRLSSTFDSRSQAQFSIVGKGKPADFGESFTNSSTCFKSSLYKNVFGSTTYGSRCYQTFCASDNKVRVVVNGQSKICSHKDQRIYFDGYSGTVICPDSKISCANLPVTDQLIVNSIIPDRGPLNGGNVVRLSGSEYDLYENHTLMLGNINLEIMETNSTTILAKIPTISGSMMKEIIGTRLPLISTMDRKTDGYTVNTRIEDVYLFYDFTYE